MKEKFLIFCWGKAGSLWLGCSLHMHPDIICSSGTDHPFAGLTYWNNSKESEDYINYLENKINLPPQHMMAYNLSNESKLNVENYVQVAGHGFMGSGNLVKYYQEKDGKLLNLKVIPRKSNLENIDFFFDELNQYPKIANVIGNVHGFCQSAVWDQNFQKIAKKEQITCLNLIRHPITRWESQINNSMFGYEHYEYEIKKPIEDAFQAVSHMVPYFRNKYKVDFDDIKNRVYLTNLYYWDINKTLAGEISSPFGNNFILMERLKQEPDYFAWLVNYISKGLIVADNEYLAQVYSNENMNAGRNNCTPKKDKSPLEVWENWPNWVKDEFRRQFYDYELDAAYNKTGYDLSYI